jgi:hypothetical protein
MIGMFFEAGVVDTLDPSIGRQPAGDGHRVRIVPLDPHRERLEPASERVRGMGIQDRPHLLARLEHPRHQVCRPRQRPGRHVGMAIQVLGRAVHHDVDAEPNRLLVQRGGEGVVDHGDDAARAAGARHGRNVHAAQRRVDRRLEPHELRRLGEDRFRRCELLH